MRLHQLLGEGIERPSLDPDIHGIADDSRRVEPGFLFVVRAAAPADVDRYVAEALLRGAVALLVDRRVAVPPSSAAVVRVDAVPPIAALLADRLAGSPSKSLRVIGVTGTNGKTTIAYLLQQLLHGSAGGPAAQGANRPARRCGLIGTVEIDDGRGRRPATLTTPGAIELARLFADMVAHDCRFVSMEVSSHALHQERVAAVDFVCGIFTNLTGDHLDYHGSMEEYAAAKARLFARLAPTSHAVVNADDPWCGRVTATRARTLRCSARDDAADCRVTVEAVEPQAMRTSMRGPWGSWEVRLPLVGAHNAMNALQAAAAAWTQGVSGEELRAGLERCTAPPGRLEPVTIDGADGGFTVLVDYAHSDDALLNVLTALRPVVGSGGQLRVVFGCGGDRDRTKRPRMAAVACRHADEVIVTSDNPRTEDPRSIVADILAGVPTGDAASVVAEVDRARAIALAIERARPGDVVLIAGKGHENYQIVGVERRSFDDREEAAAALRRRWGLVAQSPPQPVVRA